MSSASPAAGRRASSRPTRGPRASYVIKTVFSDDDEDEQAVSDEDEPDQPGQAGSDQDDNQPSTSTRKQPAPKKKPVRQKKKPPPSARNEKADVSDEEPADDVPGEEELAPASPDKDKKKKQPSAAAGRPKKKRVVVDSDEEMDSPPPPADDDDDDSGSAFDPGDADDEPADDDDPAESAVEEAESGSATDFSGSDDSAPRRGANAKQNGKRGKGRDTIDLVVKNGRAPRQVTHPRLPTPKKVVITTNSLPSLPTQAIPRLKSSNTTRKGHQFNESMHSESLPPLVPHFTSCLLAAPGLGRASKIGKLKLRGGERADGGQAMSEGALAERVRTMTTETAGMCRWEGWAGGIGQGGEGWRPRDADQTAQSLWQGVGGEDGWKSCVGLSEKQALSYLPSLPTSPPKSILTGMVDNVDGGPIQPSQRSLPVYTAQSLRSLSIAKEGCLINPGGPTRSVSWCPMTEEESEKRSFKLYLALSVMSSLDSAPPLGHAKSADAPGSIQIWSTFPTSSGGKTQGKGKGRATDMDVDEEEGKPGGDWDMSMQLEMVLCFEGGMSPELKWCPVGAQDELDNSGRVPKLGILAGTFEDGTIKLFAVPDPEGLRRSRGLEDQEGPLYVHVKPLTTVAIDDGMCNTFDWGSGRLIVVGTTAGQLATWDVWEAVRNKDSHPLPLLMTGAHTAPIRRVTYLRHPQADANGDVHLDWEQTLVASVAANGRVVLTDLRDVAGSAGGGGSSTTVYLSRGVGMSSATGAIQDGCVYFGDIDSDVQKLRVRAGHNLASSRQAMHSGQVWDVSHSDFHPTVASASADGSLIVTPTMRGTSKNKRSWVRTMDVVYRVDKNELTGEIRLIENILPQNVATSNRTAPAAVVPKPSRPPSHKPAAETNAPRAPHPAWPADQGVLCCSWNDAAGIGRAGMLASGMACGLARVDVLEGRWRGGGALKREELKALRIGLIKED